MKEVILISGGQVYCRTNGSIARQCPPEDFQHDCNRCVGCPITSLIEML